MENLLSMEAIVRCFELAPSLKINFSKSRLVGVNMDGSHLSLAVGFLNCKSRILRFKFIGIPIEENPRRAATWNLMSEMLHTRLLGWKHSCVNLGGRIVFLSLVLSQG